MNLVPKIWDGFATALPALAEPVLTQLFLTPMRKVGRREGPGICLGHIDCKGRKVAIRSHGRGPIVLLVHGWQGHMGQFSAVRSALVAAGYCVVGCDMPAHGETAGRTSSIVEFCDVLMKLAHLVGPLHAVVAHSLGATAASLALQRGLAAEGAVFIAPLISFDFALDAFARTLKLGKKAREVAAIGTERRAGIHRAELDLLRFKSPHSDLLLIHDKDDQLTHHQDTARLCKNWGSRFYETEGLGHSRILRSAQMISVLCEFVDALPRPDSLDLDARFRPLASFQI